MKLWRTKTDDKSHQGTGDFDSVPVRSYGLFEWSPIPAPYQPKTVDELAEEAAARVLAELDRESSTEPEPRT